MKSDEITVSGYMDAMAGQAARDIVSGFAAGYNRYLSDTGVANLPAECKGADWVKPMSEDEAYLRLTQATIAGSSLNFINSIGAAQPPAISARAKRSPSSGVEPAGHVPAKHMLSISVPRLRTSSSRPSASSMTAAAIRSTRAVTSRPPRRPDVPGRRHRSGPPSSPVLPLPRGRT